MRRNEARLIAQALRKTMKEKPEEPLLILGDFNDHLNSKPLEYFFDAGFEALPLGAEGGDWTHYNPDEATYSRWSHALANKAFLENFSSSAATVLNSNWTSSLHRNIRVYIH